MKTEYAVVLYFDDQTNAIFYNMINKIAEITGNYYMVNNQIPPHITIGDFFTEDEPDISKFKEKMQSGEIVFNDLGSFDPCVFYAAPAINDYLRNCNKIFYEWSKSLGYEENKLYAYNNWIPHLTIATKLNSEQLQKAFSVANFTPFSGRTEKIALVKCNPYKEIDCYAFIYFH